MTDYCRPVPRRSAFKSGQLPTRHFHERFSDDNLAFWVPRLIEAANITREQHVLDVGCGTGGFAMAIASQTGAMVTGVDEAEQFLAFARQEGEGANVPVRWLRASAEALPFDSESYDRVLLSLVLHQLDDPARAVREAFRVLRGSGIVLVRSISPEDAPNRVPERYIPSMAAADAARMPSIATLAEWLTDAGFEAINVECHVRNKMLNLDDEIASLRAEVAGRYSFVTEAELDEGVRRMRAEAARLGSPWIDLRPTYVISAVKRR